jgi:predicted nuclease of predicted toxin-antitoxin system
MRFLVDTNLPPALARWLAIKGHEADHAALVMGPQADDRAIWARAVETNAIVVTKDSDYVDLAAQAGGARVVWVRCGNLKLAAFKDWFEARSQAMDQLLAMGEAVVELR